METKKDWLVAQEAHVPFWHSLRKVAALLLLLNCIAMFWLMPMMSFGQAAVFVLSVLAAIVLGTDTKRTK